MMVIFVCQCEKKALKRTRRVLDSFANRIGDNTWQTVITEEGLSAVKKLLRKTASKSTAVSCHWMRSRTNSELVWVVGNKRKFSDHGFTPTNKTSLNHLKIDIENDWQYLPLIKALVGMAALLHDWGKASELFQRKLQPTNKSKSFKGDPVRHEWVSCLLLNALVKTNSDGDNSDKGWLNTLSNEDINEADVIESAKQQCATPLAGLPPIATLLAWLIVTHHRLPLLKVDNNNPNDRFERKDNLEGVLSLITQRWSYENRFDEREYQSRIEQCFKFSNGLMSNSRKWMRELKKIADRLLACEPHAIEIMSDTQYRPILNHARLCLMLGDHQYSSEEAAKSWRDTTGLFANTDRKTKAMKQKLDEHLYGVAKRGVTNAYRLPDFETQLPFANSSKALKKLSPLQYRWQDKAVDAIKQHQKQQQDQGLNQYKQKQGFFIVNMASTGCGKTFANAKVMRALSNDGDSLRFILALGLRTLTLQTGDEFRQRVGLDETEFAVLIGSKAVLELHTQQQKSEDENYFEDSGSRSAEPLLDESVDYECSIPEDNLSTLLKSTRDRKFLYAPVLACTIDHIMAATETKRGGRYILPTLRLMSSDLVIDEIDDFTGDDLIAIGRLVHLAGMLGRKVMISSATIPPDIAEGYFHAYRKGWLLFSKTRNASANITCAWVDEFKTVVSDNSNLVLGNAITEYRNQHLTFIKKRVAKLQQQQAKRKASIIFCESIFQQQKALSKQDDSSAATKQDQYFDIIYKAITDLHAHHHTIDDASQLRVSFGVVRVANISPCVALSKYLLTVPCDNDIEIRVMPYHSQQVLLLRHEQEQHLDLILKRKEKGDEPPVAFSNKVIRHHIDTIKAANECVKNIVFILVATPVEEVGRDHDFDWAVVEPSSYRSIIQLAGRVRRHRSGEATTPNIALLQYNWKGVQNYGRQKDKQKAVFTMPGYESDNHKLETHDLKKLVDSDALAKRVDAIPRIQKPTTKPEPKANLADLEHHETKRLLTTYHRVDGKKPHDEKQSGPKTVNGYLREAWFMTAMPQYFKPFRKSEPSTKVFLVYLSNKEEFVFCEKDELGDIIEKQKTLSINNKDLNDAELSRLWLTRNYEESIEALCEQKSKSRYAMSLRFGELSFIWRKHTSYEYSDQLGLVKIDNDS